MKYSLFLLIFFSFFFVQCDLFKKNDPGPDLPPATQQGLNTFGCYVNGEPWIPEGPMPAGQSRLTIQYDPSWRGGILSIAAHKKIKGEFDQLIYIVVDSIPSYGESNYILECIHEDSYMNGGLVKFFDNLSGCSYVCNTEAILLNALCTITKYDLPNRIFSGTFEFTLAMPECDTIRVTDGRFDMKLHN